MSKSNLQELIKEHNLKDGDDIFCVSVDESERFMYGEAGKTYPLRMSGICGSMMISTSPYCLWCGTGATFELPKQETKPVYTQEMRDKQIPPVVGMLLNISFIAGASFLNSELTYLGDGVGCFKNKDGKEYTFATNSVIFDCIDTRTDEEKINCALTTFYKKKETWTHMTFIEAVNLGHIPLLKYTGTK